VTDIAGLLAMPMDAAARAEGSEQAASETIDDLRELHARVTQFRSGVSRWQERLAHGMQEATIELDNDLRTRMRSLAEQTAARIDEETPADDLVFEAWLQKVTVEELAEHYRKIADRANELASAVAQEFAALDEHAAFEARTSAPTEQIGAVRVEQEQRLMKDGVVRRIVTTGQGYSSGVILLSSVVGVVSAMPWIPLVALPFAGLLARRAFSEDRDKRLAAQRQELLRVGTRHLDEVGFIVHADSRDTLRRLEQDIRDHYQSRADELDRTLQQALAAAERTRAAAVAAAASDTPDTSGDRAAIGDLMDVARRLVTAGAGR
jgi:hypothetical protein